MESGEGKAKGEGEGKDEGKAKGGGEGEAEADANGGLPVLLANSIALRSQLLSMPRVTPLASTWYGEFSFVPPGVLALNR